MVCKQWLKAVQLQMWLTDIKALMWLIYEAHMMQVAVVAHSPKLEPRRLVSPHIIKLDAHLNQQKRGRVVSIHIV